MASMRFVALALLSVWGCGDDETTRRQGPGEGGQAGMGFESDCPPPNRVVGDACLEPGVSDDGCPAGTLGDGCAPAGIAPDGCGEPFVHDGDAGCEPILPALACEDDADGHPTMAVPGDAACRPIGDCGSGTWGNIPVDANTVYVDGAYTVGDGDGSAAKPFDELDEAIAAADPSDLIAIAAGSYFVESFIGKPLTIQGVCASQVLLVQDPFGFTTGAIDLSAGAAGTVVRDVAIGSSVVAVQVSAASDVLLERLYLRNNSGGLQLVNGGSATMRDSLVEKNTQANVFVYGSSVVVERSVLRRAVPAGTEPIGAGIWVQPDDANTPSDATVRGSLIEEGVFFGAYTSGSTLLMEDTVVRNTQPNANGFAGRGVTSNRSPDGALRASVTVRRSYFEGNTEVAAFAAGGDLVIEDTVIRDTKPAVNGVDPSSASVIAQPTGVAVDDAAATLVIRRSLIEGSVGMGVFVSGSSLTMEGALIRDIGTDPFGEGGRGLYCRRDHSTLEPCIAEVTGSVIARSHDVGVYLAGSTAQLTGVLVQQIQADMGGRGRGISIEPSFDLMDPSNLTLDASVVEDVIDLGLYARGSHASIRRSAIRRVVPSLQGGGGRCLSMQVGPDTTTAGSLDMLHASCSDAHEVGLFIAGSSFALERSAVTGIAPSPMSDRGRGIEIQRAHGVPAEGSLKDCRIADGSEHGVVLFGAHATLEGVLVEGIAPNAAGLFGDGIAAFDRVGPPDLTLIDSIVRDNARAGVAGFSGAIALEHSEVSCNLLDLVDGGGVQFEDRGDNSCGCPAGASVCKLQSDSIEPPTPVGGDEGDGDSSDL